MGARADYRRRASPRRPISYNRKFSCYGSPQPVSRTEKRWWRCFPACLLVLPVDIEFVNRELWRRQQGYGRGGRMRIERDTAHILSGVRHGKTIGSPIAMLLANKDWQELDRGAAGRGGDPAKHKRVASPRPGHADLAGAVKYNFSEARYVLERASARESAARVAAGALAKLLLRELGIEVLSHVIAVGRARLDCSGYLGGNSGAGGERGSAVELH